MGYDEHPPIEGFRHLYKSSEARSRMYTLYICFICSFVQCESLTCESLNSFCRVNVAIFSMVSYIFREVVSSAAGLVLPIAATREATILDHLIIFPSIVTIIGIFEGRTDAIERNVLSFFKVY